MTVAWNVSADGPIETEHRLPEPRVTKQRRRLSLLVSGIAFFAGYVLSAGPTAFIVGKFKAPFLNEIVTILYAPLIFTSKNVPVIGPIIKAWVSLFNG
ncbi:MAG: hypothetical protein R3C49_13310 [Planctomycetaceae bacterium]